MALPKQIAPSYTCEVPSTKQKLKFRPFLVKEQKALLLAQQSEDVSTMADTLKQVIASCAQSELDVEKLAVFDLEYLFCQIRAKSVGERIDLLFYCNECDSDKAKIKISIDVTTIKINESPDHNPKIELFDDVGIVMKYPSIDVIKNIEKIGIESEIDMIFDVVSECIDYIYDSEEIYYTKDQTKEEVVDFINNLTTEQFAKVERFFETMPKLQHTVNYNCPVCGKAHEHSLEGLNSFF